MYNAILKSANNRLNQENILKHSKYKNIEMKK